MVAWPKTYVIKVIDSLGNPRKVCKGIRPGYRTKKMEDHCYGRLEAGAGCREHAPANRRRLQRDLPVRVRRADITKTAGLWATV